MPYRKAVYSVISLVAAASIVVGAIVLRPGTRHGATSLTAGATTTTGPMSAASTVVAPTPGAAPDCTTAADKSQAGDPSANDDPPVSPTERGGTGSDFGSYPDTLTASSVFATAAAIAELDVVGRDAPYERASGASNSGFVVGEPQNADAKRAPAGGSVVSRPIRLKLVHADKGAFPNCVALDLPGGVANAWRSIEPSSPARIRVGDRLLVIFASYPNGELFPEVVTEVQSDGSSQLPYLGSNGSPIVVNAGTWAG